MVLCPICKQTIAREEKKTMACTVTCQAIFHGKCLNADESEFEALRALRKNWVCPKCEKARKNIQPTDKCLSPPRSAPQQQTVDSTSQLLLAAIKNLTEEVKGLKFSLDANANEVIIPSLKPLHHQIYALRSYPPERSRCRGAQTLPRKWRRSYPGPPPTDPEDAEELA
ncbi:unnamed protein product [Nezara viridula]|uniref:PHD-type domain-containing protein n=1 Tax=Nezara viridula TaxID=85310 RepID=A0A9P0E150_NEZVI|nr:unnamed protein product [Nezara viridula]